MLEPWIAPSILSADFARLGEEVLDVLAAGADIVHFDVMDNHYVPNLTIGPLVCEALCKAGVTAPIDVHLMVSRSIASCRSFARAGATWISFHPEASEHVDRTIGLIRDSGCRPGLVLNPASAAQLARPHARQARHGAADVGQSGLRRAAVHPGRAAKDTRRPSTRRPPAGATYGSRWMAASRSRTSPTSPRPGPTPSWPARPSSRPGTIAQRSPPCAPAPGKIGSEPNFSGGRLLVVVLVVAVFVVRGRRLVGTQRKRRRCRPGGTGHLGGLALELRAHPVDHHGLAAGGEAAPVPPSTFSTRPAISREQPTSRASSWRADRASACPRDGSSRRARGEVGASVWRSGP